MRVPAHYREQYDAFARLRAESWPSIRGVEDLRRLGARLDELCDELAVGPARARVAAERVAVDQTTSVDVLTPLAGGVHPLLMFFHGGAWVMGSARGHRQLASRFAEQGFVVVNVDYGLAPERPFPGGLEDCLAATRWAVANADAFGADPDRLVLAGDSAGANLACALALTGGDVELPRVHALGLLYGAFDMFLGEAPETAEPDERLSAPEQFAHRLRVAYLGDGERDPRDPRVNPVHAADQLPPCSLAVGSLDGLLPQSVALAERLRAVGTACTLRVLDGYPHAFAYLEGLVDTLPAVAEMAAFLHEQIRAADRPRATKLEPMTATPLRS